MENNFQHFWNLSEEVAAKRNYKLQSHYLLQCKEVEGLGIYDLPSKLFSELMLCKFCFNVWNPGNFHMKILPQRKPGRKMIKLLHKRKFKKPLTKCELSLLDKYDDNFSNKISFLCLLCHKGSKLLIRKPLTAYSKTSEAAVVEDNSSLVKKKKKKKKDPFAGLNKLVCTPISLKQKHSRNNNTASEPELNSSSKQTLKHLKTTNASSKSNQKLRNPVTSYNSPLTSKPLKSKGLQKVLFQDKNKSKVSPLKAFLADL